MRNKICAVMLALCFALTLQAQRKQITQAKENVKKGTNLEAAEKSMRELLADSANRQNDDVWLTLFAAIRGQYEQGNEKFYLKQTYDTAKLFNAAYKMFQTLESFDSVEAKPDNRGRVKLKYRKRHAEYLSYLRPNLFGGGAFFIKKQNYKEAYSFFDAYIDCGNQPLFSGYNFNTEDKRLPEAAYWAAYCGYKLKDVKLTLHHAYVALKDTAHHAYMLQYLAESYLIEKDTARYVEALREGFDEYPKFSFFFPRLMEYYGERRLYDKALSTADRAIAADTASLIPKFAKTTVLLNMGRYVECAALCDSIIARNDSVADVYLNAGLAHFNQALALEKSGRSTAALRKKVNAQFAKSLPYLEKYRAMTPTEQHRWASPLYTIYYNLNMGDKFKEIDRLINKQ